MITLVAQVQPSVQEEVSGLNLMVIAYLAIWLVLFIYFYLLWKRQKSLQSEVQTLEMRIKALKQSTNENEDEKKKEKEEDHGH